VKYFYLSHSVQTDCVAHSTHVKWE
jgi:hypothetical protein